MTGRLSQSGFAHRGPIPRLRHCAGLIVLGMVLAIPSAPAFAQDASTAGDDALQASTMTVNVELILDASGSMAEEIPGTEAQSRMDAAQAAMREVIDGIPERDGLNVGFRVYGHEGSNSEADRAVSCQATELLVPMLGVDKAALLMQVEQMEPTGWTPLSLALESAAGDFVPGGESVTNAIIMVTDGEETCGGDPCQVAGALHAANIGVATHVVGFALTREQRQAVRCIAEQGGGQLFSADNAESLSDAVFAAFTQVETPATPVPAEVVADVSVGGYVGGNAFHLLDAGTPGELSVVAAGVGDDTLSLVVRNNTGADVENLRGDIVARANGQIIATGTLLGVEPFIVRDGDIALANGYFSGAALPEGTEFEFSLAADPAGTDDITGARDLIVADVNGVDSTIVGIYANPHDETIEGFIIGVAICFDEAGQPNAYLEPAVDNDEMASGGTRPFSIGTGLFAESCANYLVAGQGSAAE